jgi:spore maturation protein CgeB
VKILFVGQLGVGQTSRMRLEALRRLGHEVDGVDTQALWARVPRALRWAQELAAAGPTVHALNRDVLRRARAGRPSLVWAEKQEYLRPETLLALGALGARTVHFTPDPYFTLAWKRTPLADACLPLWDVVLHCKRYEDARYRAVCRRVLYMPLGFDEATHRPLPSAADPRWASDVCFVGGWEPRRERLLGAVAASGARLKIWGYGWDHLVDGRWTPRRALRLRRLAGNEPFAIRRHATLAPAVRGAEIYGDDYARALSGAAIGVGFLRAICPDEHTTRTFEIPACGSMLLADRTPEHLELFAEGAEAEFFASEEELVDKLRYYLAHPDARTRVAAAGRERCRRSGYDYGSRLARVLDELAGSAVGR